MLPSRNKRKLRVYLSAQQVLPDSSSVSGLFLHDAESAEQGLLGWLTHHASELSNVDVEIELSGVLSTLFCLPFSPAMDSPASILRIAEGYAKSALGKLAPALFSVAEPLNYGSPPVIVALQSVAGFAAQAGQLTGQVCRVEAYALASWNRYASQLPNFPCWLVVVEPSALTFFYSCARAIEDVFTLNLSDSTADYSHAIKRAIQRQFHRQSGGLFCIDEFSLVAEQGTAEFEFLALQPNGFSHLCAENMA